MLGNRGRTFLFGALTTTAGPVTEGKSDWSANHLELLMQFPSYPPQRGGQIMPAF